ncbi:MAG: hypothetical protein D6744_17545, partial [Planctomycetota bacterium]
TTSSGDNAGLALLAADLVQDPNNPASLDIPPASGVPAPMSNFSRPDGVSNPGETDPTTGYIGVQRGTAGAMNLIQIGGGQNNTGVAQPPGTGVAENATMVGGVGQSGAETLASGSFSAPSVDGVYTFSLDNVIANVIATLNSPPNFSPVVAANVVLANQSITFTVSSAGVCGPGCGDASGDADVDDDCDVDLTDLAVLLSDFDCTSGCVADTDGDGDTDLTDLARVLSFFDATCP